MKKCVLMSLPSLLILLALPQVASAYSEVEAFDRDPSVEPSGGGGGMAFTGSPRQHGLSCESCHVDGPADIGLRISSLLPNGETGHLFEQDLLPGVVYEVEVAFAGDRLGPVNGCLDADYEPCNLNLFAAEVLDAQGEPAGAFCPIKPRDEPVDNFCGQCAMTRAAGTRVVDDCQVVYADAFNPVDFRWRNGVTATSFYWRAPRDEVGPLTFYISAVDGRGKEEPEGEVTSHFNDGTATLAIPIGKPPRTRGCGRSVLGALLLPGLALLSSRRRRRR